MGHEKRNGAIDVKLIGGPLGAVAAKDATSCGDEPADERNEGAEYEPVRVSPRCVDATVTAAVTCYAEEDHFDDPCDECDEKGKRGDQGHEYRPGAVIACTAKAEKEGKS